jgi:hypothetical protein
MGMTFPSAGGLFCVCHCRIKTHFATDKQLYFVLALKHHAVKTCENIGVKFANNPWFSTEGSRQFHDPLFYSRAKAVGAYYVCGTIGWPRAC